MNKFNVGDTVQVTEIWARLHGVSHEDTHRILWWHIPDDGGVDYMLEDPNGKNFMACEKYMVPFTPDLNEDK